MSDQIKDRLASLGWTIVSERPEAERVTRRDGAGESDTNALAAIELINAALLSERRDRPVKL